MQDSIIRLRVEQGLSLLERRKIHEAICGGKVLIFPTDTIYGLGCDATNEGAIKRIYEIKGRPPERPFSVHLGSVAEIERYVPLTEHQRTLIERLFPGPYTVVLKASKSAPPLCVSHEGKIGLRVPKSRSFQLVYEAGGRPLVGTSVNISGEPPLTDIEEIIRKFSGHVELIIATDEPMSQKSSVVIDLTVDPPRVLRGSLPDELK